MHHPTGQQAVQVAALQERTLPEETYASQPESAPARGQPFSFHLSGRLRAALLRHSHLCPGSPWRLPPVVGQESPPWEQGSTVRPTQRPRAARDPRRISRHPPGGPPCRPPPATQAWKGAHSALLAPRLDLARDAEEAGGCSGAWERGNVRPAGRKQGRTTTPRTFRAARRVTGGRRGN